MSTQLKNENLNSSQLAFGNVEALQRPQPWIFSARADLGCIIAPPFLISAFVLLFPHLFADSREVSPWAWLGLVLCVDVAHVYGTLYKTYFDPSFRKTRSKLLWVIPVLAWAFGAVLYAAGELTFWRAIAYLAVFHFIRQQYGFMRFYRRKENGRLHSQSERMLDTAAIYSSALYPLIYWHTHLPRKFNWFVAGDFFQWPAPIAHLAAPVEHLSFIVFCAIQFLFFGNALKDWIQYRNVNVPKVLLVLGTTLSWYLGIVVFNGDLAFTALNVLSHGIPYLALVWFTERTRHDEKSRREKAHVEQKAQHSDKAHPSYKIQSGEQAHHPVRKRVPLILTPYTGVLIFVSSLILFAYVEEALWDSLIWRDHPQFFSWIYRFPTLESGVLLTILVPLLSLPQITHYLLDGFIWKVRDPSLRRSLK